MDLDVELERLAAEVSPPPVDLTSWRRSARRRRASRVVVAAVVVSGLVLGGSVVLGGQEREAVLPAVTTADPPIPERAARAASYVFPGAAVQRTRDLPAGPMGPDDSAFGGEGRRRVAGVVVTVGLPDRGQSLDVNWQVVEPAMTRTEADRVFRQQVPVGATHIAVLPKFELRARADAGMAYGFAYGRDGSVVQVRATGRFDVGQVMWLLRALVRDQTKPRDAGEELLGAAFAEDTFVRIADAYSAQLRRRLGDRPNDVVTDCVSVESALRLAGRGFLEDRGVDGRLPDGRVFVRVVRRFVSPPMSGFGAGREHGVVLFDAVTGNVVSTGSQFVPGDGVPGREDTLLRDRVACPPEP
jgi:hypothetical protein